MLFIVLNLSHSPIWVFLTFNAVYKMFTNLFWISFQKERERERENKALRRHLPYIFMNFQLCIHKQIYCCQRANNTPGWTHCQVHFVVAFLFSFSFAQLLFFLITKANSVPAPAPAPAPAKHIYRPEESWGLRRRRGRMREGRRIPKKKKSPNIILTILLLLGLESIARVNTLKVRNLWAWSRPLIRLKLPIDNNQIYRFATVDCN